jgi:hypothetical protein
LARRVLAPFHPKGTSHDLKRDQLFLHEGVPT